MSASLRSYQQPHVEKLIAILKERKVAHDGSDTGTGKMYCGAYIAGALGLETLVICPLSVCVSWRRVLEGFGVKAEVWNYELAHRRLGAVVPWGKGSFFKFSKVWPLIIYDESHRCGGDTTLNAKLLIAAKRQGSRILTLSATAADTMLKLRALGYALDLHKLTDYRMWLFTHGVTEQTQKLKNGRTFKKLTITKERSAVAMQRLHEQIYGAGNRGSRMRIADIADFPETQIEVKLIEGMPSEVKKLSDELQAWYRQRNVLAQYSQDELAKLTFWRQSAEIAKIPPILDMIEDALETSKVAVFVNYSQTMDELLVACEKRGWTTGFVRGEQSGEDRQKVMDAFQANRTDVVVCNIQAGGEGISLHALDKTPRTALISPSWSGRVLKQALGRVHRNGGGPSRQWLIYWSTGIETRVAATVQRKIDNLELLNDGTLSGLEEDQTLAASAQPSLAL